MSDNNYNEYPQEQDDLQLQEAQSAQIHYLETITFQPIENLDDMIKNIELEKENRNNLKLL